jgi:spermidine synthase
MKSDPLIFKTRTNQAEISIEPRANCLELRTTNNALQSVININRPHKLELKNLEYLMGVLLFLPNPRNILLLGTGGGSLIHFVKFHYPQCRLTSVELDSELQALMHQNMLLPKADETLIYVIDDAANYLHSCSQKFDLILVDIFSGNQSPDWLLNAANIQQIYTLLSNQGAVAYNLLIDSEFEYNLFHRNLTRIFSQQTLFLPVEEFDNTIAYGIRNQPKHRGMPYYLQQASNMTELHDINYNEILATIYSNNPVGTGII